MANYERVEVGDAVLYHGDCMDVMADMEPDSLDMVLTDPPYGMSYVSSYRDTKHDPIKGDDNLDWLPVFAEKIEPLIKNNTAHYFFTSYHYIDIFKEALSRIAPVKDLLVWEKNNTGMGDLSGSFAPKVEFVLFLKKGKRDIEGGRTPNIFRFDRTQNDLHPTQKPVELMEHLTGKFSRGGNLVFDPFMGSGSTGVACANLQRKFIGIEKERKYFDIACDRIDKAQRQGHLFGGGI